MNATHAITIGDRVTVTGHGTGHVLDVEAGGVYLVAGDNGRSYYAAGPTVARVA